MSYFFDNGKEFISDVNDKLCEYLGVVKLKTTVYSPSTNGAIERFHRVLNTLLAKVIKESQKDWSTWISYVTFCYNATVHSATGFSPFF